MNSNALQEARLQLKAEQSKVSESVKELSEFKWTDELVLLAMDYAHHNGYHKFPQRVVDVFDEVKHQATHGGYKSFPDWITEHIKGYKAAKGML